eukprot:3614755-Pleurochrysis_carterae.AAC.2
MPVGGTVPFGAGSIVTLLTARARAANTQALVYEAPVAPCGQGRREERGSRAVASESTRLRAMSQRALAYRTSRRWPPPYCHVDVPCWRNRPEVLPKRPVCDWRSSLQL